MIPVFSKIISLLEDTPCGKNNKAHKYNLDHEYQRCAPYGEAGCLAEERRLTWD